MKPILSIIIPAFNAAQYINRCLDSIYISGGLDNTSIGLIETIVVDDCSKDNTSNVVEEYIETHNLFNLRLVRHAKNLQQGAARNTGLKRASGSYVWFVDVDDIIMPGFLSILQNPKFLSDIDVF